MKGRDLAVLAALLVIGSSCASWDPVPVPVEMPGVTPFPPASFTEIIVTNFRDEAPLPDFQAGPAFETSLAAELGRAFKGTVSSLTIPPAVAPDPLFWKQAAAGRDRAVFLTGSVRLSGLIRKALQGKNAPLAGLLKASGRRLVEQLRWTFAADISIVSAATGEPLYQKTFIEELDYIDLEKTAEFAFHALSDPVRVHLFQILLGTPTIERRALLKR